MLFRDITTICPRALYRKSKMIPRFPSGSISPSFCASMFLLLFWQDSLICLGKQFFSFLSTLVQFIVCSSVFARIYGWGVSPLNIRAFDIKKTLSNTWVQ